MCVSFTRTIRAVTKLLEDLVFFVVDIPNNGQDVLEIMVNKPNRERQKLMREQNILKQVTPQYSDCNILNMKLFEPRRTPQIFATLFIITQSGAAVWPAFCNGVFFRL